MPKPVQLTPKQLKQLFETGKLALPGNVALEVQLKALEPNQLKEWTDVQNALDAALGEDTRLDADLGDDDENDRATGDEDDDDDDEDVDEDEEDEDNDDDDDEDDDDDDDEDEEEDSDDDLEGSLNY